MYKLKPCPFCGNSNIKDLDIYFQGRNSLHVKNKVRCYSVHCWNCGANGTVASTEKRAVEKWNNREASTNE